MTTGSAPLPLELDPLIAEARRRTRRRLLAVLLLIALGATATLAFGSPGGRSGAGVVSGRPGGASAVGSPRSGPLAWPKDSGHGSVGLPVKAGQVGVLAIPLGSTESRKAVLLDVRLQDATVGQGLTIRYAATTGHGLHVRADARVVGTDGGIGWKRVRWGLRPVGGFVVQPHTTAAVVIGASAAKPGIYRLMRSFVVNYRIGDVFYRAVVPYGFQLCVAVSCSADS
jgi:hypothetical protein